MREKNKKFLEKVFGDNNLAQGYIFVGEQGLYLDQILKNFLKSFFCDKKVFFGCSMCHNCQLIEKDESADILNILPGDDKKTISIDDIRKIKADLSTYSARQRFIVFKDVSWINKESFNALLKIIEEVPTNVTFFFIANSLSQVIPTVKSRCQVIRFLPLTKSERSQYLASLNAGLEVEKIVTQYNITKIQKIEEINNQYEKFNGDLVTIGKVLDEKALIKKYELAKEINENEFLNNLELILSDNSFDREKKIKITQNIINYKKLQNFNNKNSLSSFIINL